VLKGRVEGPLFQGIPVVRSTIIGEKVPEYLALTPKWGDNLCRVARENLGLE
jgi:hypothetical protein